MSLLTDPSKENKIKILDIEKYGVKKIKKLDYSKFI